MLTHCFSASSKDDRNVSSTRGSVLVHEVNPSLLGKKELRRYQLPLVDNQAKNLKLFFTLPPRFLKCCHFHILCTYFHYLPSSVLATPHFMPSSFLLETDWNSLLLHAVCSLVSSFRKSSWCTKEMQVSSHHSLAWNPLGVLCATGVMMRNSLTKLRSCLFCLPLFTPWLFLYSHQSSAVMALLCFIMAFSCSLWQHIHIMAFSGKIVHTTSFSCHTLSLLPYFYVSLLLHLHISRWCRMRFFSSLACEFLEIREYVLMVFIILHLWCIVGAL